MRLVFRVAVAVVLAAATTAAGYALADREDPPGEALGPEPVTIRIDIEHSLFDPSYVRVVEGTDVRFVVINGDPINHELIVGPPEVHDVHRDGNHPEHPPVPGELSVRALDRGVTTYTFDEPGTVEMACHLPGHYEHGMHGEVEVVPAAATRLGSAGR